MQYASTANIYPTITFTELSVHAHTKQQSVWCLLAKGKKMYSAALRNFPFIKQFNVVAGIRSI